MPTQPDISESAGNQKDTEQCETVVFRRCRSRQAQPQQPVAGTVHWHDHDGAQERFLQPSAAPNSRFAALSPVFRRGKSEGLKVCSRP
jgi:hypothetical protein